MSTNEALRRLGYTTAPADGLYRKRILRGDGVQVAEGTAHEISAWLSAAHPEFADAIDLPLWAIFKDKPSMIGKRPFEVGDRVTWKGYPATVVEIRATYLSPTRIWWANSYYAIACENGRHLVDFIDAHLTGGGALKLTGGAS